MLLPEVIWYRKASWNLFPLGVNDLVADCAGPSRAASVSTQSDIFLAASLALSMECWAACLALPMAVWAASLASVTA